MDVSVNTTQQSLLLLLQLLLLLFILLLVWLFLNIALINELTGSDVR